MIPHRVTVASINARSIENLSPTVDEEEDWDLLASNSPFQGPVTRRCCALSSRIRKASKDWLLTPVILQVSLTLLQTTCPCRKSCHGRSCTNQLLASSRPSVAIVHTSIEMFETSTPLILLCSVTIKMITTAKIPRKRRPTVSTKGLQGTVMNVFPIEHRAMIGKSLMYASSTSFRLASRPCHFRGRSDGMKDPRL